MRKSRIKCLVWVALGNTALGLLAKLGNLRRGNQITFFFLTQTKNMGSGAYITNYMVSYICHLGTLFRPQRPHPAKLNRLTCWPTKTPWRLFSTTDFRFGVFGVPRYYSSGCWLVVYTYYTPTTPPEAPRANQIMNYKTLYSKTTILPDLGAIAPQESQK